MSDAVPSTPRRRWPRVTLWVVALLVLVPALLAGGLLWWASSDGSLARALRLAQRWLPAEQQLVFDQAQGSLARGGRIAHLAWRKPGRAVTVDGLQLDWSLRDLLGRALDVRTLSIERLQVSSTPQPEKPDEPFVMPDDLTLPVRVTLPIRIGRIELLSTDEAGVTTTQVLQDLSARYQYDGRWHHVDLASLRYGESGLSAQGRLEARTLELSARADAALRNLVPEVPFSMRAAIEAQGSLAGNDRAALALKVDARQLEVPETRAATLQAQANIHPWRAQPVQQAQVQLQNVDAHAFHVAAPVTALRGSISVLPSAGRADRWDAKIDLHNAAAGAWDQQRLPLRELLATLDLSGDRARIGSASAELGGRASAGSLQLQGEIPLEDPAGATLQLALRQLNLQPLLTTLPVTSLSGPLTLDPLQPGGQQLQARLENARPGPLDQERLPLDALLADLRATPAQWRVEAFEARMGTGQVKVRGDYVTDTRRLDLRADFEQLPLRQIHRKMANETSANLSGHAQVAGSVQQALDFNADLSSSEAEKAGAQRGQWEIRQLRTRGRWSPTRLTIQDIHLDALQAVADGRDIDVTLPGLDSLRAKLDATAPGLTLHADAAMLPRSGGGTLDLQLSSAETVVAWLRGLPIVGEQLPAIRARGKAAVEAEWQGGWQQWKAGLQNPASQPSLRLNATASTDELLLVVPAATSGVADTRIEIRELDLVANGNLAAATLSVTGDARANDMRLVLDVGVATSQLRNARGAPRWRIDLEKFSAAATLPDQSSPWQVQVSDNLQVVAQLGADIDIQATAGSLALQAPREVGAAAPLQVNWEPVRWRRTARGAITLQSKGAITGIQPAWLDTLLAKQGEGPLTANGVRTDLLLSGDWDVALTDRVAIRAHLQRDSGDLSLVDSDTRAGIRTMDLVVEAADENVRASLDWDTTNAGVITARVATRLEQEADGWRLPDGAPLSGSIQARLSDLSTWAFLAPPGWRIQGQLDASVRLGGTVQLPQFTGGIEGSGLNVRSVLDGVDLHNGTLQATLRESRMEITELTFEGGTGSRAYVRGFSGNRTSPPSARGRITARGTIDWGRVTRPEEAGTGIAMDLRAELTRMQVLVRHDRQMTLSGTLSADLAEGALRVRGDLHVDRASIVLPEASAPTLGDDVVIVRNANLRNPSAAEARQVRTEMKTRKPMDMEVKLDLGRDLALEGQGITTRLEGALTVRSASGAAPFAVFGEVRTVEGRYRAWGQALNVETGIVRFNGSYENPTLELLAIRPNIEVRAGVRVTGTLLAPRVQLFSDPDLPEGEKLSWVVLGRATVITGAEGSSMQQAALGLAAGQLSGRLASGLGLDEVGLSQSGVSIGKRISNELYLTYQQGLAGAASTLFIFYDITRRLTVRAQASEASAVDLVYTITFD